MENTRGWVVLLTSGVYHTEDGRMVVYYDFLEALNSAQTNGGIVVLGAVPTHSAAPTDALANE